MQNLVLRAKFSFTLKIAWENIDKYRSPSVLSKGDTANFEHIGVLRIVVLKTRQICANKCLNWGNHYLALYATNRATEEK